VSYPRQRPDRAKHAVHILVAVTLLLTGPGRAQVGKPAEDPASHEMDTSPQALKKLGERIAAEINRIRQTQSLPPLKIFHPNEMQVFCRSWASRQEVVNGIHNAGSNPITGTSTVYIFDATAPLEATVRLQTIAVSDRPRGKNGKLAIDDAHRVAVEVCPLENPARYRVAVGYWYSSLGVFLDSLPRGHE